MYLILKVLGLNLCFHTFFINYLCADGGGGSGPTWKKRRVGAHVELINYLWSMGVEVAGPRGGGLPTGVGMTTMLT
jgi:hypothetical protein